jgi:UPF0755 protein
MKKRIGRGFWITLTSLLVLSALVASGILYLLFVPVQGEGEGAAVKFEVAPGERLDSIAARLHKEGLLHDPLALKLAGFFGGGSERIKAGKHELPRGVSAWDIFHRLQISPKGEFFKVTIPEGADIFQIAEIVGALGLSDPTDFMEIAGDPAPVADLFPEAVSLEGFFYPDTYHLPVGAGSRELVEKMLGRFREVVAEHGLEEEFNAVGLNLLDGVILASLIAKEAGNSEEMPLISSVFHNRMKIGMKLDCDPTFIYARKLVGNWDGKVGSEDTLIDSPYNTYVHGGLPPAPIGNPGLAAFLAAAKPAETEKVLLYFVAKSADPKDGHVFSATPAEHERNRREYFKKRKEARQGGQ